MFISVEHEKGSYGACRWDRGRQHEAHHFPARPATDGHVGANAVLRQGVAALTASHPRSPGPVTANPASSMGRQVQSNKSSAGSIGFGTGKRLADHASDVPGPGERRRAC